MKLFWWLETWLEIQIETEWNICILIYELCILLQTGDIFRKLKYNLVRARVCVCEIILVDKSVKRRPRRCYNVLVVTKPSVAPTQCQLTHVTARWRLPSRYVLLCQPVFLSPRCLYLERHYCPAQRHVFININVTLSKV